MKSKELEERSLREPVDRGVRLVALSLIDEAQQAAEKLMDHSQKLHDGEESADEALHDFRVEVRRLRSWIRAFKPWLSADVARKRRRRLSKIADATRDTRDATVHLEWLHSARQTLSASERLGQSFMADRVEKQRNGGIDDAISAANDFGSMAPKLTRRLKYYRSAVCDDDAGERFGAVYSQRLLKQSEELRESLARVHSFADVKQAHRARIAAKNLRYLLEPVASVVAGGDAVIESLKRLQDLLGDLHDVHVFGDELEAATEKSTTPGLTELARRLHARGMHAFDQVEEQWLNDSGAGFFDQVRDLAERLSDCASAGTEIEHKYLLEGLPPAPSAESDQRYTNARLAESAAGNGARKENGERSSSVGA